MRLFVALDIADEIRQRIARFMEGVREFAPEPRWVREESLHVDPEIHRRDAEDGRDSRSPRDGHKQRI